MNGRVPVSGFPWSTFAVNILGSFLIGVFYALSARFHLSNETRLFLTVGLCGGFTTFSTFSNESLFLFKEGLYPALVSYILSSILLGVLAVWVGAWLSYKV
jgi:CrcB protein